MADYKVAEKLKLSQPHRAEISRIAAEYNRTKSEVMMSLTQQTADASPDGSRRAVMMRLDASQLENIHSPAYLKLDAAKQAAETKIMALLSPEEKAAWNQAIGTPKLFRKYLPGNRF